MTTIIAPVQSNVTAGEFSPEMDGQVNFEKYPLSARILENAIPRVTGTVTRRPGTRFIVPHKHEDRPIRLIDFEYSTLSAYALEIGADGDSGGYIRFMKERAQIQVAETTAAIANGAFDAGIASWTDQSSGGGAIAHDATNGRLRLNASSGTAAAEQTVSNAVADQSHVIAFRIDATPYDPVTVTIGSTSGASDYLTFKAGAGYHARAFTPTGTSFYLRFTFTGGKSVYVDDVRLIEGPMELGAPFRSDMLARIKYTQSADVLYLATGQVGFQRLERYGHTSWSILDFPFQDGPYLEENTDTSRTLQPGAASGKGVSLTAAGHAPFAATDVGRLVRLKHSSTWGWGVIVGYTSPTVVTIDIRSSFGATTAVAEWRLGLFSDTDGHASAVALFQQRVALTGGGARASRVDGSATSDFENFVPGTDDADAISYLISDGGVNAGRFLSSLGNLIVGTAGGNFRIMGETEDGPLTPTAVKNRAENRDGAADIQALALSNVLVSIDRHRRVVRGTVYSFEANGLIGTDLTRYAEHITESGIKDMAWQKSPWETVWCVRDDGSLVGLVFARQENVIGWFRNPMRFGKDAVEAVCTIPGARQDDLYLSVKRMIDGVEHRYIEVMVDRPMPEDDPQVANFYVDSGLTLDNAPQATLAVSAVSGSGVTVTASASTFSAGDVGHDVRYRYRTRNTIGLRPEFVWATAKGRITAVASATQATVDILDGFPFPTTAALPAGSWRITVDEIAGADHLEGETVQLVGDGGYLGEAVVTDGAVTLPTPAGCVHLGLASTFTYLPQRIEGGSREGSMVGKKQRPFEVILRLINTPFIQVGQDYAGLEDLEFRNYSDPMDEPVPHFTGDHVMSFKGTNTTDGDVLVVQELPLPVTLVMLGSRRLASEGT